MVCRYASRVPKFNCSGGLICFIVSAEYHLIESGITEAQITPSVPVELSSLFGMMINGSIGKAISEFGGLFW